MANLFIHLFGPVEVMLNGKSRTGFHSDKERALLAFLCLEAAVPQAREKLAGLLWPDYPESTARTNLRNALANLRQVIGDRPQNPGQETSPNFLIITRKTLQFNNDSDAWVDALAFLTTLEKSQATVAELEAAVGWYRDTFMVGFSLSDSNLFEEWLIIQRERFRRLAFDALYRLVEVYTTQGEYKSALIHSRRMVAMDPLRESAQQAFMRLLTYTGQSNQALVQYEKYTRLLADEIGVEPLDETSQLYLQIKDGTLKLPSSTTVNLPLFLKYKDSATTAKSIFVGFENEIAQLNHTFEQALDGQGQVVFIIGEPGSGKSVLASEFTRQAMASHADLLAIKGRCNAYTGIGDPYLPFREMMDMLTGDVETRWAGGEISGQHARRLWAGLTVVLPIILTHGQELIDLLIPGASMLARTQAAVPSQVAQLKALLEKSKFSTPEEDKLNQVDLFEQYTKVLQALSQRRPLILMVDDLQWVDPGSIGLLFHLGRRLRGSRILLIGAYRPEEVAMSRPSDVLGLERHPLEPVIHEFQLEFGDVFIDLDQSDGRMFVNALIDTEPNCLPEEFREVLFQHTGGHPLFSIELLRGLQNRGELIKDDSGRWRAQASLNWTFLPPRVDAVIAERISRLPREWQSILSAASIEGEVFTIEAVAQVLAMEEDQVLGCLSGPLSHKHHLVEAQDLEWLGEQRLSHYRFRHFLFQKYLYDQFDPVQRAQLHQAVGTALETLHEENAEKQAVLLARHFEEAGMTVKAVEYLLQAGESAARLYANTEAIAHFRHGLRLVETLDDTPQREQLELALLLALAVPLKATHGFSGDELAQTFGRAQELIRESKASHELFQTLSGFKTYYMLRGDFAKALEISEELLRVSGELKDPGLMAFAHHQMGATLLYLGQPSGFLHHREHMAALYDHERDQTLVYQTGLDAQITSLCHAGWAHWLLGYPDKAKQRSEEAVNCAKEWGNPFFLSLTLMFAACSSTYRRDVEAARKLAEETITVASEHGHPLWLGGGLATLGWALVEEGKLDEGIDQIHHGLKLGKAIGAWMGYTLDLRKLIEAYRLAGQVTKGLAAVDEALTLIGKMGSWLEEPEVHRLHGELLLLEGGMSVEAEACFQRAIQVAKEQQAKSWELRATTSLCRLWQGQRKREQARESLAEIYHWFTEGFDTPDLKEAKSLLEALS